MKSRHSLVSAMSFALVAATLSISPANADVIAPRGFNASTPRIAGDGAEVSGDVCRAETFAQRPRIAHVARIGANGEIEAETSTMVYGALGRSRGCGHYTIATGWRLAEGESIRVSF